ncbi:hypothetical protein NRB_04090 [Novosphingobium sp. 11B]
MDNDSDCVGIAQVNRALDNAFFSGWPQDEFELLEFFVQLRKLIMADALAQEPIELPLTRQ